MDGGVVIYEQRNRDVIKLQVENFNLTSGGVTKLDYLYSGVSNTRRVLRLMIVKDGDSFYLADKSGKKINRLFVKVNRAPVLGIVGVKEILSSYAN